MIKVIVNGANGKMGSLACKAIANTQDIELLAGLSRQDDLAKSISTHSPDVVLDLTVATAAYTNARTVLESGTRAVIGTSGLDEASLAALKSYSEKNQLGVIVAPNFSMGAMLMNKLAHIANMYFEEAEIIEMHHANKQDAPSGTARHTQSLLKQPEKTPIHSVRLPGLLAHQKIMFGASGETLSIQHDCLDRSAYMPGIVRCVRYVNTINHFIYGLENLEP